MAPPSRTRARPAHAIGTSSERARRIASAPPRADRAELLGDAVRGDRIIGEDRVEPLRARRSIEHDAAGELVARARDRFALRFHHTDSRSRPRRHRRSMRRGGSCAPFGVTTNRIRSPATSVVPSWTANVSPLRFANTCHAASPLMPSCGVRSRSRVTTSKRSIAAASAGAADQSPPPRSARDDGASARQHVDGEVLAQRERRPSCSARQLGTAREVRAVLRLGVRIERTERERVERQRRDVRRSSCSRSASTNLRALSANSASRLTTVRREMPSTRRDLALVEAIDVVQPRRRPQLLRTAPTICATRSRSRGRPRRRCFARWLADSTVRLRAQLAIADLVQAVVGRDPIDPGQRIVGSGALSR